MHREEEMELRSCIDCGAVISVGSDRGYAFGTRGLLCAACAIQRGGEYDGGEERWVRDPDLSGLEVGYD